MVLLEEKESKVEVSEGVMVSSSSKKPFYQRQTGNFVFVVRPVITIKVAIGGGENDTPCRVAGGASKS